MSRRQNPEEYLWPEMRAAILGQPAPEWGDNGIQECDQSDHADLPRTVGSNGSNNWGPMAAMVRYVRRGGEALRELWFAFFEASFLRWMGRELDSTTYDSFHVCSVLGVAARADECGHRDVATAARKWLMVYAARALARWDDDSHGVLAIGQRSAGHDGEAFFADDFLRVGKGWRPPARWREDGRDKVFLWKYAEIVREVVHPFLSGIDPVDWLFESGVGFMASLCIVETSEGKAAWHEPGTIHGSTQSVPVAVSINGFVRYAPARRGANDARLHRQPGACTVTRVYGTPGALIYTSPVFADERLPLPGGRLVRDVRIGGHAPAPPLPDEPPVDPPAPPAPPPTSPPKPRRRRRWWEFWR